MPRDDERDTDPAPPPKPTPFPGTRMTIRLGDTGEGVCIIQRAVGVADHGTFDLQTEIGVRAFQTSHGLPATGVVDVRTWEAISTEAAP
jgi:murein L,D-transpeptidase YcbB/YkuD